MFRLESLCRIQLRVGLVGTAKQTGPISLFQQSGCFRQKKNLLFKLAATAGYIISFPVDHGKFFTSVWKKRRRIMAHRIPYLSKVSLDDLSETDTNRVVFVSGYIGRSVSLTRSCSSCKQLLVASEDTL